VPSFCTPHARTLARVDAAILKTLSLDVLQQRLNEALTARHKLACGQQVVDVMVGPQRTRFNEGNATALETYIGALQAAILAKQSDRPVHAPIYLDYGGR
jgi:hypothetical protein